MDHFNDGAPVAIGRGLGAYGVVIGVGDDSNLGELAGQGGVNRLEGDAEEEGAKVAALAGPFLAVDNTEHQLACVRVGVQVENHASHTVEEIDRASCLRPLSIVAIEHFLAMQGVEAVMHVNRLDQTALGVGRLQLLRNALRAAWGSTTKVVWFEALPHAFSGLRVDQEFAGAFCEGGAVVDWADLRLLAVRQNVTRCYV